MDSLERIGFGMNKELLEFYISVATLIGALDCEIAQTLSECHNKVFVSLKDDVSQKLKALIDKIDPNY